MTQPQTTTFRSLLISLSIVTAPFLSAQVINDAFDLVGDETYNGGFGSFNWVSATGFGFTDHAGAQGFLSAYSGVPIPNIGMTKPLGGAMSGTTYRVSFYTTKYAGQSGIPFTDFNQLYIGSPNGLSVWDSVPTPTVDGFWLKWSGTFTPALPDIGQPFVFGLSMTLNSGVSMALDGPVVVEDLITGISVLHEGTDGLQVIAAPGTQQVMISCALPMEELAVIDAQGRVVQVNGQVAGTKASIDVTRFATGCYSVLCRCSDGSLRSGRFMVG